MATDWTTLKVEYVNGSMSLRDLAAKHGIKAPGLMKRSANEGWEAERKQIASKVSKQATAALIESKAEQLSKFNSDDLKVAKGLRAKAAGMMNKIETPADLRSIAGVFESAQRLGRTALGADSATPDESDTMDLPVTVTIERKGARVNRGITQ